jgi:hypothetical protein
MTRDPGLVLAKFSLSEDTSWSIDVDYRAGKNGLQSLGTLTRQASRGQISFTLADLLGDLRKDSLEIQEGRYSLRFEASEEAQWQMEVVVDRTAPQWFLQDSRSGRQPLAESRAASPIMVADPRLELEVEDPETSAAVSVSRIVAGQQQRWQPDAAGHFTTTLAAGEPLEVLAQDAAGNPSELTFLYLPEPTLHLAQDDQTGSLEAESSDFSLRFEVEPSSGVEVLLRLGKAERLLTSETGNPAPRALHWRRSLAAARHGCPPR